MSCIEPEAVDRILNEEGPNASSWTVHLERCTECREREKQLGSENLFEEIVHPSADALVAFDEVPETLDPAVHDWMSAHVESCELCREALAGFPASADEQPTQRGFSAPGGLLAAAAILFVVGVSWAFRGGSDDPGNAPSPSVYDLPFTTVVLSTTRGDPTTTAKEAQTPIIRFQPNLGVEVKVGDRVSLKIQNAYGAVLVDEEVVIRELDEDWGRAVLPVERKHLSKGRLVITIGMSGEENQSFHYDHR